MKVSISFAKAKKISVKLAVKNASPTNRLSLKPQIYHSPALQDSVNSSYCEKKRRRETKRTSQAGYSN